jgi:hypothetical protein
LKKDSSLSNLVKQREFREKLVAFIHNQLIKEGSLQHYVVMMGTQYMLQVKYRKASMIKFDIAGHTLLMYEVPYIDVPTLTDASKLRDSELEESKAKNALREGDVRIENKQCEIND